MSTTDDTADGTVVGRAVPRPGRWVLTILAAAGLAVNSYVHLTLASNYDANTAATSQGRPCSGSRARWPRSRWS